MPNKGDKTKRLLEQLLGNLYNEQAKQKVTQGDSFLIAQDGQYLGKITTNRYDNDSIINRYGPYGSRFSATSIFNKFSQYGSRYGSYSINNPYCTQPPTLVIKGKFIAYISNNRFIKERINPEDFILTVENNINELLRISGGTKMESVFVRKDSYIQAQDGAFLGKLTSDEYETESILNKYGNYGSEYSTTSIFNSYGSYGSPYSSYSPYNEFTSVPPKIFLKGTFWGHLTKNQYLSGNKLDPDSIKNWIYENGL